MRQCISDAKRRCCSPRCRWRCRTQDETTDRRRRTLPRRPRQRAAIEYREQWRAIRRLSTAAPSTTKYTCPAPRNNITPRTGADPGFQPTRTLFSPPFPSSFLFSLPLSAYLIHFLHVQFYPITPV